MCDKCDLLDRKIQQFQSFTIPGLDALSLSMMRSAIEALEAEKVALNCDSPSTKAAPER
jgi:hypothetical protein